MKPKITILAKSTKLPRKIHPFSRTNPVKVVVNRPDWGRGSEGKMLDIKTSKMCCLGFLARAIGFTEEDIAGTAEPRDVSCKFPTLIGGDSDRQGHTLTCNNLMHWNDNAKTEDPEREAKLTKLGARIGIKFVFKG